MTRYALLPFVVCLSTTAVAQSTPEQDVLTTLDRFFAAMTARDTAAMAATILRDGDLHIASHLGGEPARTVSFGIYLTKLAQGKERFVERYWGATVRVDGPLATATMPYDFHVDGAFSHCGIDVATLVKGPDGWRIASVAYTRQTEGCPPSPLGPYKP
ncbi:MAG: nuclear transport factor 2 family protein [Flavobacteriales bacterium]|nr:nuclear transport factor 2 family protein [Flavobacteriales bacterium]